MAMMKHLRQGFKSVFFATYARGFFSSYLFAILIGAFFLKLPISLQGGQSLSWVDAFFTAASALSVTGLSTIVVKDVFTTFGLIVLLFIIQFGGIGLIMMVSLFWLVARRKIGFRQRNMIMTDQNQNTRAGIVRFIRNVLIMIFTIEAIAFVVIATYLYSAGYFVFGEALFQALFLAISLFTNAGFDIAPNADSFQMFNQDFFMQSVGITLMFLGSVGFWTLAELKEFVLAKIHREKFTFSFFVKLIFVLHVFFWLFGAVVIMLMEWQGFLADKSFIESIYYGLFMSITTRNAGFSTMNVNDFGATTRSFIMVLMFIGANPNSVGGGIRTTTILILILGIRNFALGKPHVVINERTIKPDTVMKSYIAFSTGIVVVMTGILLVSAVEHFPTAQVAFEVTSAFGTTGLSTGLVPEFSWMAKAFLIVTMFIGRLGILALLLMFRPDRTKEGFVSYPEIDVIVG